MNGDARDDDCSGERTVLAHAPAAVLEAGPDLSVALDGEPVDPTACTAAVPDPAAGGQRRRGPHLLCVHPDEVQRGADAVAPVRIDRFGVVMRVDTPAGSRRARLDLPAALRGPAELSAAMCELVRRAAQVTACPFTGAARSA